MYCVPDSIAHLLKKDKEKIRKTIKKLIGYEPSIVYQDDLEKIRYELLNKYKLIISPEATVRQMIISRFAKKPYLLSYKSCSSSRHCVCVNQGMVYCPTWGGYWFGDFRKLKAPVRWMIVED